MRRCRDGDVAAFDLLLQRHQDRLWRFLIHGTEDPEASARMFREIWSQVLHGCRRCELPAPFRAWLYGLGYRHLLDHDRLRCLATAPAEELAEDPAGPQGEDGRWWQAFRALSVSQRALFLLRAEGGFALSELADITGLAPSRLGPRLGQVAHTIAAPIRPGPSTAPDPALQDEADAALAAYRRHARDVVPPALVADVRQQGAALLPVPVDAERGGFRGRRWRYALAAVLVLSFCVLLVLQQDPRALKQTLNINPVPVPPILTPSRPLISESVHDPAATDPAPDALPPAAAQELARIRTLHGENEAAALAALRDWRRQYPQLPLPADLDAWLRERGG